MLCVETHTISIPEENEFNVEVEFVYTSTDLVVDGTMTASDVGYDYPQWHETNANVFDKSITNKFNVMNEDVLEVRLLVVPRIWICTDRTIMVRPGNC